MSDRDARIEAELARRLSRPSGIPAAPAGPVPLSPVQRSLWLLAQLADGEAVNHRPLNVRLRGRLDVQAMAAALTSLIERHSILRTTFPNANGQPVQVVGDPPAIELVVVDVSATADPAGVARRRVDEHGRTPFDLTVEPPFRPLLIRIGEDDHVLAVGMHHIVFDGWSERRFLDELAALYDAAADRRPADLPALSVQVRDVVAWQAGRIDADREEADLAWWERRLADLPPDLELPVDRPPLGPASPEPVEVDLGPELSARLAAMAATHDATLFMVLCTAVQSLIMRLSSQQDVVVGFPTAGREHPDTEPLIGCFIDTIALRSEVDPDAGFDAQLARTRGDVLDSLSHTAVPFSRVIGAIRPWSGGDRTPLYRVAVQLRNFPEDIRDSRYLAIEPFAPGPGPDVHLAVRAEQRSGSLRIVLLHDSTRFRRDTIVRWSTALRRILEAAVDAPRTPIGDIQLMGAGELALVGGGWDGSPQEAMPQLADQKLRAVARRRPDSIAAVQADRHVTYREFDGMVDRIAGAFAARGLGPEDRVVLFLDRSIETAAAVFGALRAAVAYVPVDTELAAGWLDSVISQVRPGLVLVDRPGAGSIGAGVPVATVEELLAEGGPQPERPPRPDDLAYVLYTSGSTGRPKGVMVEQGNLATFLSADDAGERSGPGSHILWFHSMSFDAVAKGLHVPLTTGATMIVRDEESIRSIPRFLDWCGRNGLTHLPVPTSFAHVLFEEAVALDLPIPDCLEVVAFGGEQARADVVEAWLDRYGDRVQLRNTYGPTEATIWLTGAYLESRDAPFGRVPIGRPYRTTRVRVVDGRGNLTPIGVPGELLLGGPLVARGYLDSPEITAERFSEDPDGVRWYRSGDLGRWLPNGTLEVLGRLDRQVKVRGFRVEPGEIEAVLRDVPGVRDAAAVVLPGLDGDLALHAYAETELDPVALSTHLEQELPAFLRPSSVTTLGVFPRSISGKLDANALPPPGSAPEPPPAPPVSGPDTGAAPPASGPTLGQVAAIWSSVLGVDDVQAEDGFFALGGHSLIAIRVIARVRDQLGVEVPLPTLFTHPTLGEFAAIVDAELGMPAAPPPVPESLPVAAHEPGPEPDDADLAGLLDELEQLSDEEVAALLDALDADGPA